MLEGYKLRVRRDIDSTPADIYDSFFAIYDEPLPDWILASRRDLRVGGVWDITFQPPGKDAFSEHRILTVIDPPHCLQYTATITAANAHPYDTVVTFRAEQVGTITSVSLTQAGFPDLRTRDEFAAAWPDVFDMIIDRLAERT
jgi:uncharacterized protein YndB with AHSA1/START domain